MKDVEIRPEKVDLNLSIFHQFWQTLQRSIQDSRKHLRWRTLQHCYASTLATLRTTEVVVRRCSVKKVFLKISQNSEENICARVYFLIKLQLFFWEFYEILKNTFSWRTPRVMGCASSRYTIQRFTIQRCTIYA